MTSFLQTTNKNSNSKKKKNYEFWFEKKGGRINVQLQGENDPYDLLDVQYFRLLYGRFKNDSSVHLLVKHGLSMLVVGVFDFQVVIPKGTKSCRLFTENQDNDISSCMSKFNCQSLEKVVFECMENWDGVFKAIKKCRQLRSLKLELRGETININVTQARILSKLESFEVVGTVQLKNPKTKEIMLGNKSMLRTIKLQSETDWFNNDVNFQNTSLQHLEVVCSEGQSRFGLRALPLGKFLNLRVLSISEISLGELIILLGRTSITKLSFSTSSNNERAILGRFENTSVKEFNYYIQGRGKFLKTFIPALRGVTKIGIFSKLKCLHPARVMMYFTGKAKINEFTKMDNTALKECFSGLENQIVNLKLVLPFNKISTQGLAKLTNLSTLGLTCINFSEVFAMLMKNNPKIHYLQTRNLLKVKHLKIIEKSEVKSISYCSVSSQEFLRHNCKNILSMTQFKDIEDFDFYEREIEMSKSEELVMTDYTRDDVSETIPKKKNAQNKAAVKYELSKPYVKKNDAFWKSYVKRRTGDEKGRNNVEYEYASEDEDELYVMEKGERTSEIKKRIRKDVLDFLNEKFAVKENDPSPEEEKLFERILNSIHFFSFHHFRSYTNTGRVYSITGNGIHYDLKIERHDRARYSYCEHHHYFHVAHSEEKGKRDHWGQIVTGERLFMSTTDYDGNTSNRIKKVLGIDRKCSEAKTLLFGDGVFSHVSNFDIMVLLYKCCFGQRVYLPGWVRKMYEGTYVEKVWGGGEGGEDTDYDSGDESDNEGGPTEGPLAMIKMMMMMRQGGGDDDGRTRIAKKIYGEKGLLNIIFGLGCSEMFSNRKRERRQPANPIPTGCNIS